MAITALYDVTQQFQAKNGTLLTNGKIYVYFQGRSELATTYNDIDATTVNSNPIIIDNHGQANCFVDDSFDYTIVVTDAFGSEQFSKDIHPGSYGSAGSTSYSFKSDDGSVKISTGIVGSVVTVNLEAEGVSKEYVDNADSALAIQISNGLRAVENNIVRLDNEKQDKLTAGSHVEITEDNVINVVDVSEVPNVEILSSTLDVTSTVDRNTNTKTFTIDTKASNAKYWAGYINAITWSRDSSGNWGTTFTGTSKQQGDWTIVNGGFKLEKDHYYLVTMDVKLNTSKITDEILNGRIWLTGGVGVELYHEFVYDNTINSEKSISIANILHYGSDTNTYVNLKYYSNEESERPLNASVTSFHIIDITSNMVGGGGGGTSNLTAGTAINIASNKVNVKYNKGLTVNGSNELEVKLGKGLSFNSESGVDSGALMVDDEVADVVATVEKLKADLDTQISTNFDMPNISGVYDFADKSVTTMVNGDTMLYQGFIVPINHEIRSEAESTDDEPPTLLGIYAKQDFNRKIMLALYQYDIYEGTTYVGDTGPVTVKEGRNEYVLKNKNDQISEIASDKVYYASLFMPESSNVNGLMLAGCPGYDQTINSRPRLTCVSENVKYNNKKLDMDNPNTTLNHYTENADGYRSYVIGPWSDGYNERSAAPRFFMTIRNGSATSPIDPPTPPTSDEPFDNIDTFTWKVNSIEGKFGTTGTESGLIVREVKPLANVTIKSWIVYDDKATDPNRFGADVYDSSWNKIADRDNNITVEELGQQSWGPYAHKYTHQTGIQLTKDEVYWFCGMTQIGSSTTYNSYDEPNIQGSLYLLASGWYHDSSSRYNVKTQLTRMTLIDIDGNTWNI